MEANTTGWAILNMMFFDRALFHLPTLMHNSIFINNMYVTPLSSTCFEY